MSNERSQPPAFAVFLLRHLCPKDNREVLIGDLLESFREGRSDGWFWRQVLIALLAGVSKGLRLHWPQICFAVVGSLVIVLESWIMRMPAIERLRVRGFSLQWPLSTAYDFGFRAALAALMLQPLLAVLLLLGRVFRWASLLRTFSISFLLVGASLVALALVPAPTAGYKPPPRTFGALLMDLIQLHWFLLMLVPFFILLISAWVGCAPSGRLRQSIRSRESQ
jgi:hypothetical protein